MLGMRSLLVPRGVGKRPLDIRIGDIARAQYGVITAAQLYALGLSPGGIAHRVRTGRLHPLHRGVYTVVPARQLLPREGHLLAAVFALGQGAALSHRSAAGLWLLTDPPQGAIHVSVSSRAGRARRRRIRVHRPVSLAAEELTEKSGIR